MKHFKVVTTDALTGETSEFNMDVPLNDDGFVDEADLVNAFRRLHPDLEIEAHENCQGAALAPSLGSDLLSGVMMLQRKSSLGVWVPFSFTFWEVFE